MAIPVDDFVSTNLVIIGIDLLETPEQLMEFREQVGSPLTIRLLTVAELPSRSLTTLAWSTCACWTGRILGRSLELVDKLSTYPETGFGAEFAISLGVWGRRFGYGSPAWGHGPFRRSGSSRCLPA